MASTIFNEGYEVYDEYLVFVVYVVYEVTGKIIRDVPYTVGIYNQRIFLKN